MSAYSDKVIADGAVAYWRLNELSGTTAASLVGSYPGTISGGVTLGQPGALADGDKAIQFLGSGWIDIPNGAFLAFGIGNLTVECWLKRGTPVADDILWSTSGTATTSAGSTLYRNTGEDIIRFAAYNTTGALNGLASGTVLADGLWHHLVAVLKRGSPDVIQCWIDGGLAQQTNLATSGVDLTFTNRLAVGRHHSAATSWLEGSLDDLAIYPTALTPRQIADHVAAASLPAPGSAPYAPIVLPSARPPANLWTPLTPSDIVDSPFSALWVGGAGTVAAVGLDGRVVNFAGVQAGTRLRISGRRVNDTATTATALLALGRT